MKKREQENSSAAGDGDVHNRRYSGNSHIGQCYNQLKAMRKEVATHNYHFLMKDEIPPHYLKKLRQPALEEIARTQPWNVVSVTKKVTNAECREVIRKNRAKVEGMVPPVISFSRSFTDEAIWYFNKYRGVPCAALNYANGTR